MNTPAQSSGLKAVPRAARSSLQWRLLLLWCACLLLPTAILAVPAWQTLSTGLDHSVYAASLAQRLDLASVADLVGAQSKNSVAFSNAAPLSLIITLLLSPLLSGMVITAARFPGTAGFGELVAGALQEYGRMGRMLLWAIVPLGIAIALGAIATNAADKFGDAAILASDADHVSLVANLVLGLLFVLAHATLDAGRAELAIDRRRNSAVKAWWRGFKLLLKRPLATVGIYLVISMVGLAIAAALAIGRINLPPVSALGFIGALVLTQLIVAVLAWMRSARLFALIDLARAEG